MNTEMKVATKEKWDGSLDEAEIAKPGGLLLAALIQCATSRGQQMNELARELGVTYGYINQLRTGIRKVAQISDDFALACAYYLGVPRLTVLMLAGRITPSDVYEPEVMLPNVVPPALKVIEDDPEWGPLMTSSVAELDIPGKYLVVRLYEQATGKKLLPERLDLPRLAEGIKQLESLQAARKAQLAAEEKAA